MFFEVFFQLLSTDSIQEYWTTHKNMNEAGTIRIGHYILGRTIGSGGFAKVKGNRDHYSRYELLHIQEAHHDLTGVRVAVKIINKARMKNTKMISKVKRQIRILKFINHPSIIKLYEVLDTTADIFVVMEMADKGELYDYIQNNDVEEEQAKRFFRQIIDGVEAAHFNLVAHRDLKPENILLDSGFNVKIADFGLSNLMKDGKFLKTSCGSLNYAAPEILLHKNYEGTSVDVWSCGIILYTLLFGALPFDEEVVSILYKKIQKAEFGLPKDVNPLVEDLLRRMIQPNPSNRIKVRDIKMHPWLRKILPIYAKLPTLGMNISSRPIQIDQTILDKVRGYDMESLSHNHDEDRIKRILRGRLDASFVTAYQLLKDTKQSKERRMHSPSTSGSQGLILDSVDNHLEKGRLQSDPHYVFGKSYTISPRLLVDKVIQAFKEMKIQYSIKNNQYCILGTYNAFPSFSKKNIAKKPKVSFGMQLHSKGRDVIIDLRLAEGHPLTFITMCHRLYKRIGDLLDV